MIMIIAILANSGAREPPGAAPVPARGAPGARPGDEWQNELP